MTKFFTQPCRVDGARVYDVSGDLVATVAYRRDKADEAVAAARIAAAPDLLEAARAAWNCLAELPPTQARVETAQMLLAALTKAGGDPETF